MQINTLIIYLQFGLFVFIKIIMLINIITLRDKINFMDSQRTLNL